MIFMLMIIGKQNFDSAVESSIILQANKWVSTEDALNKVKIRFFF